MNDYDCKIISVILTESGELEVVRKYPSNSAYGNGQACPDKVTKETYRSENGKIVLASTVEGKHTPSHVVKELIEF